ncbi:hypothetical protein M758_4G071800 [Ceratodon purpureus]|uniref:Uncharacterized protein n=1 Tax=Ceratodon purpureus TaxID=3225 RepID=A0A8T0I7W8_CERPU|nr:hypothetical protein KC19_4G070900 [Ceratodon purpureus]KAG0618535.1 hypothetical protein M758_4G071800 [Ceratodon purpureus]
MNPLNCFTSRRMDLESELTSRSMLNTERSLVYKPSRDSKRQMRDSTNLRPRSSPDRMQMRLCPPRKTLRGEAYFKNPRFGASVPDSARNQSHKPVTDEIAPWEDEKTANASQHPHGTLSSKINSKGKKSDVSAQEDKTSLPPGRKFKKRKTRSQFPKSRRATFRTVTSLVPLLGNKNIEEKQKRKPKIKPNVVKRMELLFQSGREAASVDQVQEIPSTGEAEEVPTTTPLVSNENKEPLSAPVATEKEDSHEWNNFMSEMTKTLLNLNGNRLPVPHLADVVQTQVKADAVEAT